MAARTVRSVTVRSILVGAVTALLVALGGCGDFPADPEQTLERVRGGVLRVGVSVNPPWTSWAGAAEPTGMEPDLVRRFAATLPAEIEWRRGGEEALISALERGELELVIGGLTADTPWSDQAAITKPFAAARNAHGQSEQHVMAAPLGENAFLLELERFLLGQDPS